MLQTLFFLVSPTKKCLPEHYPLFIDPRYEWSIFSGPRIQTLPSWLLIGLKNIARGKSWQNPRDEL